MNSKKMGVKVAKKRKLKSMEEHSDGEDRPELPPTTRSSDEPPLKKVMWYETTVVLLRLEGFIKNSLLLNFQLLLEVKLIRSRLF